MQPSWTTTITHNRRINAYSFIHFYFQFIRQCRAISLIPNDSVCLNESININCVCIIPNCTYGQKVNSHYARSILKIHCNKYIIAPVLWCPFVARSTQTLFLIMWAQVFRECTLCRNVTSNHKPFWREI